jgi:hypothetical protein
MADFAVGAPFAPSWETPSWDYRAFCELMAEKIDVVSRQAIHAVYRRARERLEFLATELDRVLRDEPSPDTSAVASLQGLLAQAGEVVP